MVAFRDALAGVAIVLIGLVVVGVFFISRAERTPHPAPKANRLISFEEQWRMAGMTVPLPAPRTENATQIPRIIPMDKVVRPEVTERTLVDVVPVPMPRPDVEPEPVRSAEPSANIRHRAVRDVCRGKGKVYTKNGKSWRCKR